MRAREEILARLRSALRDVPGAETLDDVPVARDYRRHGTAEPARLADLFAERVGEYRARVRRCTAGELPETVLEILTAAEAGTLLLPHDVPEAWYRDFAGTVHRDVPEHPLPLSVLDHADAVLTGCRAAIAETGTVILDSGPQQGRRAITLVPDHHICVVSADQICAGVPEALARLRPERPLTFISGPSATSDIEFDRVEGVHGPRRLDVLVSD